MAGDTVEYSVDNNESFPAEDYLQRYTDPLSDPQGVHEEFLKAYHSFYQQCPPDINSSSAVMLEFGGGPTVYSMISAAPHFKEVVFSEFAEKNRVEVLKWKNEEIGCHDWTPYVKYVIETLEGNHDPSVIRDRQSMMRSQLKAVIPCDVRADNPINCPAGTPATFDVIQTNLCLEAVCQSLEEYVDKVKVLKGMLRPGGYLLVIGAKDCSWYTCTGSGNRFYVLKMSQKELEDCYTNAGFILKESYPLKTRNHSISATKEFHFIVAQKPK